MLPGLRELGISHILGEVDFGAGYLPSSIAGAVASTRKTLVFLSRNIFQVCPCNFAHGFGHRFVMNNR